MTILAIPTLLSIRRTDEPNPALRGQVQEILEHFKQKDPLGIPGVPIPDPFTIDTFQDKISGVRLKFTGSDSSQVGPKAFKISKFKIEHVTIDLHSMDVSIHQCLNFWHLTMNTFELS
jgi:hypothetical protein